MLSGTLAVTRVPWATAPSGSQLTASAETASTPSTGAAGTTDTPDAAGATGTSHSAQRAPQDVLRDRLVAELQEKNPGAALTSLQKEMTRKPSLAQHCASIAKALGRAAVQKYGAAQRAHLYSRPVCDTSFATGIAQMN